MKDYIVTFEEWQGTKATTFRSWLEYLLKRNLLPLPLHEGTQGEVFAEVNHGRWIVECPAGCGGAIMASLKEPLFVCPYCGSSENGGKWYAVIFPRNREAIERLLLMRPARRPFYAEHRNWKPGESLAKLRRENEEHGIKEAG